MRRGYRRPIDPTRFMIGLAIGLLGGLWLHYLGLGWGWDSDWHSDFFWAQPSEFRGLTPAETETEKPQEFFPEAWLPTLPSVPVVGDKNFARKPQKYLASVENSRNLTFAN